MKSLSRVVWSEGMYLGPHHFQAQARYVEDSIGFAMSALFPFCYGVSGLQLDAEALRNDTVSVVHARGVMPDGTAFNIPESDVAPAPRSLRNAVPPSVDTVKIYLGLPPRSPDGANLSGGTAETSRRYRSETRNVSDENTGGDEKPLEMARRNFTLVFGTDQEADSPLPLLAIARARRDGAGHFRYDSEFVPACLQISASEFLMRTTQRLGGILAEKSSSLGGAHRSGSMQEYSPRDIGNFWLLHAVNSAIPAIRNILLSRRGHPEELFLELSRLAGALCTFALNSDPSRLPAYDHADSTDGFLALDQHIRTHLETVVPTNCVTIPLKKTADYFYAGEIVDSRCLGRSQWVLAVRSPVGELNVITRTPRVVKVCSAKFVAELVRRAIAGLPLRHVQAPPAAISARVETHYFAIAKEGPFWDNIVQTKGVGIYVPGDLPDAELDLFVVLDA